MQYTKMDVIVWLCHSLIHRHIDFRCGVTVGDLTADVAIIRSGKPSLLIEVKKRNSGKPYTKQVLRYEQTEIPFIFCMGMQSIQAVVEGIEDFLRATPGRGMR